MPSRESLITAAQSLCGSFASAAPISTLLGHFTSSSPVTIEHGLPALAPFLGRDFVGVKGVEEYFNLLQKYLKFSDMEFGEWVVDEEAAKVCCKGNAKFTWLSTSQSWDEVFWHDRGN